MWKINIRQLTSKSPPHIRFDAKKKTLGWCQFLLISWAKLPQMMWYLMSTFINKFTLISNHSWLYCEAIAWFPWNFGTKFYFFTPGARSNGRSKTFIPKPWLVTVKLLLNTILLNLKIVCHLGELNFIENCTKNSDFRLLSDITVDQYQSD